MDIEKLKQKIAEVVGVKSSDADLAYHLCVEKISELLDYDEALKIPGLGIFNLKREPLTRQERKSNSDEANQTKQSLIFSPERDSSASDEDPMFITINLDEGSDNSSEFDENIFSLGVDKPLVPVSSTKIDFDSDAAENLEEKISVLVSQSERIPDFDMWEDYSVVTPEEPTEEEEDPFSVLDDELKDIMAHTEIGDEVKSDDEEIIDTADENNAVQNGIGENEIEDFDLSNELNIDDENEENNLADQLAIDDGEDETEDDDTTSAFDDVFKQFEDLNLAGDSEDAGEEKSIPEDITFSDDLDLDSLVGPEEEQAEATKSTPVEDKDTSEDDEEINWNWGDELKDELESETPEEPSEEIPSDVPQDLEKDLFDQLDEDIDSGDKDTLDIGDELDIDFDDATKLDEVTETLEEENELEDSEDGEESDELDLRFEDDDENDSKPESKTIEYTPGDAGKQKPQKESSKKIISGMNLYIVVAAFVIIGSLSTYFLFFSGSEPVDELPDQAKHEEVDEDTISTQLHTKLEPNDNLVVQAETENGSQSPEINSTPVDENDQVDISSQESNSDQTHQEVVETDKKEDNKINEYTAAPNSLPEKHNVKEKPKEPVINTSELYRKIPNETRLSNLVFFDGKKYNVQVSSWKTKQQAEGHAKSLINKGHKAFIVEAYLSSLGGTWFRVRIGDFDSAIEAENYRKENKL